MDDTPYVTPSPDDQWGGPETEPIFRPLSSPPRRSFVAKVFYSLLAIVVVAGISFGTYTLGRASQPNVASIQMAPPVNNLAQLGNINIPLVAAKVSPSVATVIALSPGSGSLGSAFVISSKPGISYLMTNNHVIAGATQITVIMPDGKTYTAKLVGTDPLLDLAVLSINVGNLPAVVFGNSNDLKVGDPVVAIGAPFGNQGSVTNGIISALHRTITASSENGFSSETLFDVLQTDAPINPGNSGGPLVNALGEVIGVNVATASGASGIGYAIPSNLAVRVAKDLMAGREPRYPYLGIEYETLADAIESGHPFAGPGVLVVKVLPGSPAAKAGLRAGDIIRAVNGTKIIPTETLGGLLQPFSAGDKVTLEIVRNGKVMNVQVTLGEWPTNLTP